MEAARPIEIRAYRVGPGDGTALPLVIDANGDPSAAGLIQWCAARRDWFERTITRHGAVLLRGFAVYDAPTFDAVARSIAGDLKNHYLGTPADRLTEYVFPSSNLQGIYPIAQHCEMSYLRTPPARIFFCCLTPPAPNTGETPLADFRKVWQHLDLTVRDRFVARGIRVIRNFRGPRSRKRRLWNLERWDDLFLTSDRTLVAAKCAAEGIDLSWMADDGLRLVITQPVSRPHPQTGEPVWYNQFAAHHLSTSAWQYPDIFRLRPTFRNWAAWQLVRATVALKRWSPPATLAFHCTYADGSQIDEADMRVLLRTIWEHTVITPWQSGDVLAIDNRAIAHGRLPFHGPRRIVTCLA